MKVGFLTHRFKNLILAAHLEMSSPVCNSFTKVNYMGSKKNRKTIVIILSLRVSCCTLLWTCLMHCCHCTLPTDPQFNLEIQFKSVFKLEFQAGFGIQLGIPILLGKNLGECVQGEGFLSSCQHRRLLSVLSVAATMGGCKFEGNGLPKF